MDCLRWLVLDPTGPQLSWQLEELDNEGWRCSELAHAAGYFGIGCWLEQIVRGEQEAAVPEPGWEEAALRVAFGVSHGYRMLK